MSQVLLGKKLDEYFQETIVNLKISYEPEDIGPTDKYTAAASLHHLRAQTACLDSILAKERSRYAQRQEDFKQRWQIAAENLHSVDVDITDFDRAYKENLAEMHRQAYLAAGQDELRTHKQLDVQRRLKEKSILTHVRTETRQRLDNYEPVRNYLDNVVEGSHGEFRNARDLIERAKLLLNTRTELIARNEVTDAQYHRQEEKFNKKQLAKSNEVILLNNYIFELTQSLAEARAILERIDEEVNRVKTTTSHRTMILGQIKTAAYNMYVQMCRSLRVHPNINAGDTVRQLTAVKSSMLEMRKMEAMIRFIVKKAQARAEATNVKLARRSAAAVAEATAREQAKRDHNELRKLFGLAAENLFRRKTEGASIVNRLLQRPRQTVEAQSARSLKPFGIFT